MKQGVFILGPEELRSVIKECLQENKEEVVNPQSIENKQLKLLSRKETARLLKISLPTLNRLTKQGHVQGHRIGRRVLYKPSEVETALQAIVTNKYRRKDLH